MRGYFTTTLERTEAIFRDGWRDVYEAFNMRGVYLATIQLDANDGFIGDVTLCLDIPEEEFSNYEVTDTLMEECGYRMALIPAEVLNGLGKPQVYDHTFAGGSRRHMLQSAAKWENCGDVSAYQFAQSIREAIAFFDKIGWLTPLKLREQSEEV